jgi:hypothetical protein
MKNKNIILIPPNLAYGDCLSVIGLLYYLLEYYETVYFYLGNTPTLLNYYNDYFDNDPLFNKRIFITSDPEILINRGEYGEYHICNTMTGDWSGPNTIFSELKNINKEYYFNDLNPLYNKLNIPEEHKCQPNKHLPSNDLEINHVFYYELVGLNNTVRMDFFNYERNTDKEISIKNEILWNYGLGPNDKYNIINDPVGESGQLTPYLGNDYKTINLNYLAPSPGRLISLLEGAESIHFIEGCNVNFFYHCQFKNLFNYNKNINFHIWVRNRHWIFPKMNLDYAWKMMDTPKLNNWEFIFDKK